ncbi:MAG: TetR/AcrR family transcriptional regulator [Proteobacteria bacterium]|nr:TetR/AcrR family transcriptional regulator [Pseudomonadota bacterium]MBU1419847.1 TetR/AcrR family transcriptional regulator [Pseudomonadota bacterium]MBU1454630.1 TetR/AcrR family transcriptional regulator [Pseudomonadota bacterium]
MLKKTLSRREREKLRQRRDMLAASLELFSEKGYHNVSMQEIAERAEFALGTLYKFFKNKEDLYKTIIAEQADRFHEVLTNAMEEGDDEIEKLRNFVRTKGTMFINDVSVVRLYFAETQGASFNIKAGLDKQILENIEQDLQQLARIFESGIEKKRFRKIAEPYYLAVSLNSLTDAFLLLWLEAPERHPYPENPDVILDILCKGLLE